MYNALTKAGVSLLAITAVILLFATSAMAQRSDPVGFSVAASGGERVGTVVDVVLGPGGRGYDYTIRLDDGSRAVVHDSKLSTDQNTRVVTFLGSKDELYKMASRDTYRGYYRDRYRDDRYRDDRYRDDRYRDDRYRDRGYYGDRYDDRYRDDRYRDRYDQRDLNRSEGLLEQFFGQ